MKLVILNYNNGSVTCIENIPNSIDLDTVVDEYNIDYDDCSWMAVDDNMTISFENYEKRN